MDVLVLQVEDRVNSGNVQLMRTVMEQAQEAAVENLDRIYAYFEQQRLRDLEDMRVGYQELVNTSVNTQEVSTSLSKPYEGVFVSEKKYGGPEGARTLDPGVISTILYQLS